MKAHQIVGLRVALALSVCTLAACGGGGGGGSSASAPPPTQTPAPAPIALNIDDPFTTPLTGDGSGLWAFDGGGGGDGGDGGGDGGGGGGDGEFVKVKLRLPSVTKPTGTIVWTVLRSQFGINNNTGTLTIQKDLSGNGGYKVTQVNGSASAVRQGQSNFFISATGQITGTLPLPLGTGGAVIDSMFSGIRFKDATTAANDLSEYAGNYVFAVYDADVGTGAGQDIGIISLKINADGTGRVCTETYLWSATCPGLDIIARYDDPTTKYVIRIVESAQQSISIPSNAVSVADIIFVARKNGTTGVSMTGDGVYSRVVGGKRTGIFYGARASAAPAALSSLVGAWSYTNRTVGANPSATGTAFFAITSSGGVTKARGGTSATNCLPFTRTLTAGSVNGMVTTSAAGQDTTQLILLDSDLAVNVSLGAEIGLVRRYSSDPLKAPCQPA